MVCLRKAIVPGLEGETASYARVGAPHRSASATAEASTTACTAPSSPVTGSTRPRSSSSRARPAPRLDGAPDLLPERVAEPARQPRPLTVSLRSASSSPVRRLPLAVIVVRSTAFGKREGPARLLGGGMIFAPAP